MVSVTKFMDSRYSCHWKCCVWEQGLESIVMFIHGAHEIFHSKWKFEHDHDPTPKTAERMPCRLPQSIYISCLELWPRTSSAIGERRLSSRASSWAQVHSDAFYRTLTQIRLKDRADRHICICCCSWQEISNVLVKTLLQYEEQTVCVMWPQKGDAKQTSPITEGTQ